MTPTWFWQCLKNDQIFFDSVRHFRRRFFSNKSPRNKFFRHPVTKICPIELSFFPKCRSLQLHSNKRTSIVDVVVVVVVVVVVAVVLVVIVVVVVAQLSRDSIFLLSSQTSCHFCRLSVLSQVRLKKQNLVLMSQYK